MFPCPPLDMRSRCRSRKYKKILDLTVQEHSGCFVSRTFFGSYIYIYRVATQCSWSSLELRVQFCLLVCCTYSSSSTVNKEKNLIDQRASLRVDTRETQHPGSIPAGARIFSGSSHTIDLKIGTPVLPCQAPGIIGSVLGLVGPVSVYCDRVKWKVSSSTSASVWQHVSCLSRFVPEIHLPVAGTLSNQQQSLSLSLSLPRRKQRPDAPCHLFLYQCS